MEQDVKFPYLSLLVSGAHTELVVVLGPGEYIMLGRTTDNAIGEVYDKVARALDVPYGSGGGGSQIEKYAKESNRRVLLGFVVIVAFISFL